MKERIVPMFLFALVSIVCLAAEPAKSADGNDSWKLATERNGITIYSRPHSGSSLKEFKAVGEIAAPSPCGMRSHRGCRCLSELHALYGGVPAVAARKRFAPELSANFAQGLL